MTNGASARLREPLATIETRAVSIVWAIPALLRTLLALPGARDAFRSVRATSSVSEAILRSDLEEWRRVLPARCAILIIYSMTEASGLAAWFLPPDAAGLGARLPVGYPNPLFDFAIVAETGQPVAMGEIGELWVRGNMITLGEWRDGRCQPGRAVEDPLIRHAGSCEPTISSACARTGCWNSPAARTIW